MTNNIGIYNWTELFESTHRDNEKFGGFAEYHTNKIEIRSCEDG